MLFDHAAVGMCFVSLDGRFAHANARLCEIVGYTLEELRATTCVDITHGDDRVFEETVTTRMIAGGERASTWEKRYVRKDGSTIWCNLTLTLIDDDRGVPTQFVGIIEDISERKVTAQKLQESESLLRIAGRTVHLGGWAFEIETGKITWSDEVCEIFGVPVGTSPTLPEALAFYTPSSSEVVRSAHDHFIATGEGFDLELEMVTVRGRTRWVRAIGAMDPTRTRLVGAVQDIHEQKMTEHELVRINRALKMLSGCNEVLVRATSERALLQDIARLVVDVGGYVMTCVAYARDDDAKTIDPIAIAGRDDGYFTNVRMSWDETDARGNGGAGRTIRSGRAVVIPDVASDPAFAPWREAQLARGYRGYIGLPLRDGERTFGLLSMYASDVVDPPQAELDLLQELADDLAFGIGNLRTRVERNAAEREIEQLAFYDALTTLPNRLALVGRLKAALSVEGEIGALFFIDLDNFKTLNDTLGHDMGDVLLQQVAARLRAIVSGGDTVARFGGDEFVVMLERLGSSLEVATARARDVGVELLAAFAAPFVLGNYEHSSTPSIGVTLYTKDANSEDLLKQADLAMYQAKAAGRNAIRFFDPEMQATVTRRRALEEALRAAIRNRELVLAYQPVVDDSGEVIGAEALVRWRRSDGAVIAPNDFIPVAEESGLIVPLGRHVLETACAQIVAWSARPHLSALKLSVNVSVREFRHADFVDRAIETIRSSGADPTRLIFELTESVFADDVDVLIAKMTALRLLGVGFSLDDFGTGYSSLSYLKNLPLNQIKIDRSFVRDVTTDSNAAVIAQIIVSLGHTLNLEVVAEGVEDEAQLAFLRAAGCRSFQGFYFSKPLDIVSFERYVSDRIALA